MEAYLAEIIGLLAAFVTSGILGVLKKYTNIIDTAFGGLIKPIQPLVVAAFATIIPLVVGWLGVDLPAADAWANAPVVTLVTVLLRELFQFIKGKLPQPA